MTDARVRAPPALDALVVLDGDEFLPAIGLDGADTDRLLAGVVSSASEDDEPAGWAALVGPTLTHVAVTRVNASAVRLRLPITPMYSLQAPETIVANYNTTADPAVAIPSGRPVFATLGRIDPAGPPRARLHGELFDALEERWLRANPAATVWPLLNVSLCCNLSFGYSGVSNVTRAALLAGLSSAQDEENGWNARIAPTVSVVEVRPTSMAFSIAPNREYAVMAPETLSLTIPQSALYVCEDDLPPPAPTARSWRQSAARRASASVATSPPTLRS